jgi:hypothetical protein
MCLGIFIGFFRTQRVIVYNLRDKVEIYNFLLFNILKKNKEEYIIKNSKVVLEEFLRESKIYEIRTRGGIDLYLISILNKNNEKIQLTFYRYKEKKSHKIANKISEDFNLLLFDMSDETKRL